MFTKMKSKLRLTWFSVRYVFVKTEPSGSSSYWLAAYRFSEGGMPSVVRSTEHSPLSQQLWSFPPLAASRLLLVPGSPSGFGTRVPQRRICGGF